MRQPVSMIFFFFFFFIKMNIKLCKHFPTLNQVRAPASRNYSLAPYTKQSLSAALTYSHQPQPFPPPLKKASQQLLSLWLYFGKSTVIVSKSQFNYNLHTLLTLAFRFQFPSLKPKSLPISLLFSLFLIISYVIMSYKMVKVPAI